MEAFAGSTLIVPVQVIVAGAHVDPDGNVMTAVLSSHPLVVPTLTRDGQGRYRFTFASLSPALVEGETPRVTVSGLLSSVAWTPFAIPILIIATERPGAGATEELTLSDAAAAPRKTTIAGETIEEHSLPDRIAYEDHAAQQVGTADVPVDGKIGLGFFVTHTRHLRP